MLEPLAYLAFVLALLPTALTALNLAAFRRLPPVGRGTRLKVSLLIPARNEEANIDAALGAALASEGVDLDVVVLDDGSTDRTASIAEGHMRRDSRLRLFSAPPLPPGWCGKQHACHVLAGLAKHPLMVFVDADVRLSQDALARIAHRLESKKLDLISGFPREKTGTLAEALIVPLIHVLLLGYLPIWMARLVNLPAFAAGCGQLIAVRRDAYQRTGGHAAIKASRHDGLKLPRRFRAAGCRTDLFDAFDIARCRMYCGAREVWDGFTKNATEGMATTTALPVWSVLLGGGHILPFLLIPFAFASWSTDAVAICAAAIACLYGMRAVLNLRYKQDWRGMLLHPAGIALLLVIQWKALIAERRGQPAVWRGRAYSGRASG
jgi:cellulose synthase/poly-beta-1,6-N-acetylglucosamine synthase-like glycosyltransferase